MGAAVAGLLLLGVFFTGQAMMSRSTIHGNLLMAIAAKEAIRFSGERSRTVIAINGALSPYIEGKEPGDINGFADFIPAALQSQSSVTSYC